MPFEELAQNGAPRAAYGSAEFLSYMAARNCAPLCASKNPAQRLRDIVDNIDVIQEFTAKMDRDAEIDWVTVAAAGNVYRHEYEGVDATLIWHTVRHSLSELRTAAAMELERPAG